MRRGEIGSERGPRGRRTVLCFVDDIGRAVSPFPLHGEGFGFPGLGAGEGCGCFAADYWGESCQSGFYLSIRPFALRSLRPPSQPIQPLPTPFLPLPLNHSKSALTFHTTPHLHNLPPARILHRKRRMQMELLLHDIKEMCALQVEHLLAAREAHPLRLDAQDRGPVGQLDEVVVPGQGEDLLLQEEGFELLGEELGEDADGGGDGCGYGHDGKVDV